MRVSVNDASDGSGNGTWHIVKELGVPCFNDVDAPIWNTLEYGDGPHRVRVEAHGVSTGWDGAAVREKVYTLPHRRPASTRLLAPVPPSQNIREAVYLNSRIITFRWEPTIRANSYTLHIGTNPSPQGDPNPVFRQTFDSSVTQHTVTFSQDYPTLYWQVTAANDMGTNASGDQLFGIDRVAPACTVQGLPATTYESVFQVGWSGSDNLAGIRTFDIQYLDSERDTWNDWLTDVPAAKTYDLFTGRPGHTYAFRCRATDNADNTGDYPATADTSTKVDPSARPPAPWWNSAYSAKRNLTVLNNMAGTTLLAGYPVHLHFDSTTTPTAAELYSASQSSPKCNDLRVVHNDTAELDRVVPNCSSSAIDIWFRTQVSIPGGSSDNTAHQLYYGNAGAGDPPADPNQVWYPYREGDTAELYFFQEGSGSTAYDASNNGRHCSLDASVQWVASKFGNGLRFSRANSGDSRSLTCNGTPGLSSFTIEFWYKADPDDGGRIAGQLAPGGQLNWLLQNFEGRIRLDVWPCPTCGSSEVRSNFNLRDAPYAGNWNHIAVTFNGGNEVKFYINGALDSTKHLSQSGINTYNVPLEIGSVEGISQIKANMGAFRISSGVKASFPHGAFAAITNEPSLAAGDLIEPPVTGEPDLTVLGLTTYPNPGGGILVQAVVKNEAEVVTRNGFYTDLYLDHLPAGAGDYTGSIQFWVNDPIAAGATLTLTAVINDLSGLGGMSLQSVGAAGEISGTLYAQTDSTGAVGEPDELNNIYSAGTEICIASPDAYEGDDSAEAATPLVIDETQTHNVSRANDQDWVKFDAQAGVAYVIRTLDLSLSADTYLYLYGTDGTTLLASNDDYGGSLASQIEWTAPADGTYYVMVRHWNPNVAGCRTGYSITIGLRFDLDNNCVVDVADVYSVASLWRQIVGWPYDCNGDGKITVEDIMCVVEQWGTSCQAIPLTLINFTALVGGGRTDYQADITIDVRHPANTVSLFRKTVQTDADGRYEGLVLAGLTPGTYDVYAKGFAHLARGKTVELAAGVNEIDFSDGGTAYLAAGDVDGDNKVGWDDYEYWLSVLDTDDHCADFNGSGKVNTLDYSSLLYHWGETGDGGSWGISCISPSPPSPNGDTYEPDDAADQSSWIDIDSSQSHSIVPATDLDWVQFSLDEASEVVIETSGEHRDTRMWLYDSDLNEIEFDDDDGSGFFSRINRCGANSLPAGSYYVKIDEYGNNHEIACYGISLSRSACDSVPQILFTSGVSWDQPHDIYVMNEDGTNVRRLTYGPGSSVDGRFSPDGSKIVFASDRSGDWYIYKMNADGTCVQQLAPAGHWAAPDWSPNGKRIVYKCPPQGLCLMDADGRNIRRLTSTDDTFARWSHDGSRIVFQSTRDGDPEIYVMNADGSNQTNLTRSPSTNDWMPAWSPGDSKIAFTRWTEAYQDYIYVMNADGTGAYPITGSEHNENPVWSPDGTRIAFNSNRGGRLRNVYVMNADGSNPSRLTDRDDWPTDWR